MKHRATILVLILLPILVGCGCAIAEPADERSGSGILGAVMIGDLATTGYARRIDHLSFNPIQESYSRAHVYGWG